MRRAAVLFALVLPFAVPAAALAQATPYAGQESRAIKALSPQEVDDLLAGRGMGLAKAAELNSYPGPAHALELADRLGLSEAQRANLTAIKAHMTEKAVALGRDIVGKERDLDRRFAENRIDAAGLEAATAEIAALQGRLRAVHLAAHLETKALMTVEQVQRYDALRGYAGGHGHGGGHGGHGGGHKHGG